MASPSLIGAAQPFVIPNPGGTPTIISGTAPSLGLTPAQQAAIAITQRSPMNTIAPAANIPGVGPSVTPVGFPQASAGAQQAAQQAAFQRTLPGLQVPNVPNVGPTSATTGLRGAAARAAGGVRALGVRGAIGRAAPWLAAGQAANMGFRALVPQKDGRGDDAVSGMIQGAGAGAALGSVVPVIGTGLGAVAGATGGGLIGWAKGGDSKETEAAREYNNQLDQFNELFDKHQVSPQLRENTLLQFSLAAQDASKKDISALAQQIRKESLPGAIMEDAIIQEQERSRGAMLAAAQAWMQPMYEDVLGRSTQYADQVSQLAMNSAENIDDPAARAFAVEDAGRIKLDTATQQAYMMQMMQSLPGLYGYNTQPDAQGVPAMDLASIQGATPTAGGVPVLGTSPGAYGGPFVTGPVG